MRLIFGLGVDGRVWPETSSVAGDLDAGVVGPQGLASLIETQLGLSGPTVSRPARVASWLTKLRAAGLGRFWDRSFEKDAWSTVGTLLDWRDALIAGGWAGQRIGSPREDDLADTDQAGAPLSSGLSDRLALAARSLATRPGLRIVSITLVEPRPLLPPVVARLVDALARAGVEISATPDPVLAAKGSDLRRVQEALRDGAREALTGDGKIISAKTVEGRVLAGIKTHLLSPEAVAEAVKAFHAAAEAERRALLVERAPLERELAEIERRLKRAQTMCLDGAIETAELKTISAPLKARRTEIQGRLASDGTPSVIQFHPGAADAYRRLAADLHQAIEGDDGEELRAELRKLIDRVYFIPAEGLGKFQLEVHGSLAALLALGGAQNAKNPTAGDCGVFVGAGARTAHHNFSGTMDIPA